MNLLRKYIKIPYPQVLVVAFVPGYNSPTHQLNLTGLIFLLVVSETLKSREMTERTKQK